MFCYDRRHHINWTPVIPLLCLICLYEVHSKFLQTSINLSHLNVPLLIQYKVKTYIYRTVFYKDFSSLIRKNAVTLYVLCRELQYVLTLKEKASEGVI